AEYAGKIELVAVSLPFEKFSTNERKELPARSLRGKNERLDIFSVDIIWVSRFARWAQNLNTFFPTTEREKLMPEALQSCYYDSNLVALPLYIDVGLMYYRQDLLDKIRRDHPVHQLNERSITWQDMLSLKKELPEDASLYLFPGKAYEGLVCSFIELTGSLGGSIMKGDSVNLNTSEARQALALLTDLINKYNATPEEVINYDEILAYNHAIDKDALFFRGWPGFLEQMDSIAGKYLQIRKAPLPHFSGSNPKAVFGGWNIMVSRYTQHLPETIEFLRFLQKPQNQMLLFENGGYIPINLLCYEDSAFIQRNPSINQYRRLLENGMHRPTSVNYTQISDILSYYLNMALKQKLSVDDALMKANHHINLQRVMVQ
ncbi:MAG: extracellular solute-binding protein, partial [Calditrichota bacterium]